MTDVEVLARTIWGEARGEGLAGMEAVASVILNRVAAGRFGAGIAGVCQRPKQFSCWNDGDPNRAKLLAVTERDARYALALHIARRALGGALADRTFGATHYHAAYVFPRWARGHAPVTEIGRHIFYAGIA